MTARRLWSALLLGVACSTPALSQGDPPSLRTLIACRALLDSPGRLACFDAAVARLDQAVRSREVTVLDRESVRKTKRSLFGFSLPRLAVFGAREDSGDAAEFQEINAVIKRVVPAGYATYDLMLEDGARWQNTDPLPRPPREGAPIRIRRAALGSYFMNVGSGRSVRGKRIG